jgi:hypothetical protein
VRGKPEVHRYLSSKGLTMGRNVSVGAVEAETESAVLSVRTGNRVEVIERAVAENIKVMVW